MQAENYFSEFNTTAQKQYEALRSHFVDKLPAKKSAKKFGYKLNAFNSLVSSFRKKLAQSPEYPEPFFQVKKKGRGFKKETDQLTEIITELRKKNYSVDDIKTTLDAKDKEFRVSERYISNVLKKQGFARLLRRSKQIKSNLETPKIEAEKSEMIAFTVEKFSTQTAGILTFIPYLEKYGIIKAISQSDYPQTKTMDRVSSILAFQALKLSNIRRYSADDIWCMDRGSGLFAGLNVLPKNSWYSSYSHRVTRKMNIDFLKKIHTIWQENGLLGDTSNLDFVTVPYWGNGDHLENNWSGKRRQSLASMLSVLAHDPDSGIIDYSDSDIKHKNEHSVVLEFLDFYKTNDPNSNTLKYLVFDSKFTNYQNLKKLDEKDIKFVTIRRRGKNLVEKIDKLPNTMKRKIHVMNADGKGRTLRVNDQNIFLKGYEDTIRQISITGHGKIKPALIITNEFDLSVEDIVRKYSRRWLVEKTIAEQTDFFHINRISSSMVIKVDFDLTMTVLAHNLYKLIAFDLERYSHFSDVRLFEKFISNSGEIQITENTIEVKMKKKRDLPVMLTAMENYKNIKISWLGKKILSFSGLSYS